MILTSAGGVISLLDEPNVELQQLALTKLIGIVDSCWPEIADALVRIETLQEEPSFPDRKSAALLASKVHFHLGSYEDALLFALGAEDLFDINANTEYTNTIIAKCIDHYGKLRQHNADATSDAEKKRIDPRLEGVVDRMFTRCFDDKQYKQAIGIALESRRLDMFRKAINECDDKPNLLAYSVKVVLSLLQNRKYRNETLRCMVDLYSQLKQPDFINMCQCLIFLEDPLSVADILERLSTESEESTLVGYQIAFDLYESATQQYVNQILQSLRGRAPAPIPGTSQKKDTGDPGTVPSGQASSNTSAEPTASSEAMEVDKEDSEMATPPEGASESTAKDVPEEKEKAKVELSEKDKVLQDRLEKLVQILSGDETIYLHMQFLIKNNHTDMLILKTIKDNVRNSVGHTATVIANGYMHAGTTCDDFLRTNLEWVGKATNWAKFTAVSSLGVIHKGHEKDALRLLESYLPKESAASSTGYMEGGGLYALGLIHANHGDAVLDYLKDQLAAATAENVRHGACLGIGLAAMGTQRQDIYEQLRNNLYQDDAVTGEAAGIALGLVTLGTSSTTAIQDMVAYAQETQHEKILRGLSVGIALTMYGRLEEADPLIESLLRDKDPILRRSGVFTIALAYVGTGSNAAIRKLLHIAVNDVNDDVKRSAVTSLGFLFFRTPEQCPSMVSLLSESYNAHVRYGAAMALGIACAGTGLRDAISLLDPMLNDPVNYVRQGCMIAMALIMIQQNTVTCPKVKDFRETLTKVIQDKHEDIMSKFGAILAQGILDAGGRNVTISLQSRNGQTNLSGVAGMLIFLQYWYWFPMAHCLSLAFIPSSVIGLNSDLKMPKLEFHSNAKPSVFAYPPPLEEKKEKQAEKVETAVLSVTAKAKRKEKQKQEQEVKMDVDDLASLEIKKPPMVKSSDTGKDTKTQEAKTTSATDKDAKEEEPMDKTEATGGSASSEAKTSTSTAAGKDETETTSVGDKTTGSVAEPPATPEPPFTNIENPARVMKAQLSYLSLKDNDRYEPLKKVTIGGIIILKDKKAEEPTDFVETVKAGGETRQEEEAEPEPPEPFEYFEALEEN